MRNKISLGIVGYGFSNANERAIDYLKKHADMIEPFNHSFWHVVSDPVKEFYKTSRKYQQASISECQKVILERLGVISETIGFPANACDQTTTCLLRDDNKIKNIYYTVKAHNRKEIEKIGKRIINVDDGIVFQIHPFATGYSLEELEVFIKNKLAEGHQFVWPSEL